MNKINRLMLLISSFCLVSGCANKAVSLSDVLLSSEITSETTSLISTTSEEKKVYWDEETDEKIRYAIGDFIKDLPLMVGTVVSSITGDNDGLKYVDLTLSTGYGASMNNLIYKTELTKNDFTVQQTGTEGLYQAYKSVSYEYMLIVLYRNVASGKSVNFQIETYLYQDKTTTWPTDSVVSYLGKDIPHLDGGYYYFAASTSYEDTFVLGVYGLDETSLETYINLLKQAGYITRENIYFYNAVEKASYINLDFYFDETEQALIIQGYLLDAIYDWPTTKVKTMLGFDLPVFYEEQITYLPGIMTLENSKNYYCIECEYASSESLNTYTTQLTNDGWEVEGEEVDLPDDWPLFLGSFKRFTKQNHSIEVRYYDPSNPLTSGYENIYFPILLIIIYF